MAGFLLIIVKTLRASATPTGKALMIQLDLVDLMLMISKQKGN